jgi:predicted ribosome quality control (RQC) complex YloA/Tae2 family protein
MSFDGNIIHHLVTEWNETLDRGRIQKIYQLSRFDLLFVIRANRIKHQLFLSASPRYARAYLSDKRYDTPSNPPTFGMFLRKQLEGGILTSIAQKDNDRVIMIDIEKRNEFGDLTHKKLILEMMGRYSNIIVTSEDGTILEAIKHSVNFESNDRTIFPGAIYQYPPTDKINPYQKDAFQTVIANPENLSYHGLLSHLQGCSPLIVKELLYRYEQKTELEVIFDQVFESKEPTWITGKKEYFYHIPLLHVEGTKTSFDTVNELLDAFYYERDKKDIVTQYAKDLTTFVKNRISRNLTKIDKLSNQLEDTKKMEDYRIKGELLQANLYQIEKKTSSFTTVNYYNNEEITIELDPTLSPVKNSEQYFKRYKKLKGSIPHIKRQINDAKKELEYFFELESQLDYASLQDIEEIREELIDKKYLHGKTKRKRKGKPNIDSYKDDLGVDILVGKNNLQNEYLTHKVAKHNDVFFHVQNAPGSHVIVKHPLPLEEETIRLAAQLAAYHSKQRLSSSVPVDYTEVRYVKKIPGKVGSFVRYTNQKTIYIDPDESLIIAKKSIQK